MITVLLLSVLGSGCIIAILHAVGWGATKDGEVQIMGVVLQMALVGIWGGLAALIVILHDKRIREKEEKA